MKQKSYNLLIDMRNHYIGVKSAKYKYCHIKRKLENRNKQLVMLNDQEVDVLVAKLDMNA